MKILLYGGTFDPPHWGHINNLSAAIRKVNPHKVIVMPAGIPPHKNASATPGELRLQMCQCFLALGSQVEISDWELSHEGKSYTINTLHMIQHKWPDAEIYLTVGSDMLISFRTWYKWQEILKLAVVVVESREAEDKQQLSYIANELCANGGHVLFSDASPVPMASSDIRKGIAGIEAVPTMVWKIICENGLYGQCNKL